LYAVGVAWSAAIGPVLSGVGAVVFPVVASHRAAPDKLSVLARGARLAVVMAAACGLVLGVLAPVAIPMLFGSAFAPAIPAALILVLAAVVAEVGGVLREGARGLGETTAVLKSELFGLAAGLGTLAMLIGPLGIAGAALASLAGYAAGAAWLVRALRRATGCSTAVLLLPRIADVRAVVTGTRVILGSGRGRA
jgi:O-antigen/teichoic acid export membrane protein